MEELRNLKTMQRQGAVIAGSKTRKTGLEDYSAFKAKDGLRLEMEEYVNQKQAALPRPTRSLSTPRTARRRSPRSRTRT